MPPSAVADELLGLKFAPAPALAAWVAETFLQEGAPLHNPDHAHLIDASVGYLWASSGFVKQGRRVVGKAEDLRLGAQGDAWRKGRAEQQFTEWFGHVPDFLITIDGWHWRECGDADACALIEHELYHVAQKTDEFGAPAFTKDGRPKLGIRGHDVEEFVGVVRRYGVGDPDSSLARLVIAAARTDRRVDGAAIVHACGTCMVRA